MRFEAGTLLSKVMQRTEAAKASGALLELPTRRAFIHEHGVRFIVRMAKEMVRHKSAATSVRRNPFLPYEPSMYVADASPSHVVLLNKFTVIDHHILIVTRHFEHQRTLITEDDFEALDRCLVEIDGFAFYNGGPAAGASQPHRHLQLVPALDPDLDGVPIEPLLGRLGPPALDPIPALPFVHAGARLGDPHRTYRALMSLLEADARVAPARAAEQREVAPEGHGVRQPFPYDLLQTRRWMLLVPRTVEQHGGVQVNSLGFAGAFLARTDEERALIEADPLQLLRNVAVPRLTPAGA